MHQNDAEVMQQNATQLNPIPIPWNRINITTISSIISKHFTHTKSRHPRHPLSPSPKQVQETTNPVFFNPVTLSRITTSKNSQPPQVRSYALWLSLDTSSRLHLTFVVELFCKNNQRFKAAGYFRRRTLSWIFTGLSIQLYPIT